jgi:serine/threonine protein phosphatase PrpC
MTWISSILKHCKGNDALKAVDYAAASHVGLIRELNEDSYLALPELGLWIVADGMGGHDAGEVASRITVEEISRSVRQGETLMVAIEHAHRAIQRTSEENGDVADMGSTVVAAKLDGNQYEIAWVGDSRAYLWNGKLRKLTKDHSYVQLMLDAGMISESEISAHPSRNVISQGLGVGGINGTDIKVDTLTGILAKNEVLLLCSDGLHGEIDDEGIAAILLETADSQSRVDRLIEAALSAGGNDNVTVIIIGM